MELATVVDRKHEIRTRARPVPYVRQRIAQAAEQLSRAGDMAAHVEIANEALCKFTHMLYECDHDGVLANIDSRTHRLLVPAPWGSLGWKQWELRHWEALILRGVLLSRVDKPRHIPLFDYNADQRKWFLNVVSYPSLERANGYLKHCTVDLSEWRRWYTQYKQDRITVQSRYRQR